MEYNMNNNRQRRGRLAGFWHTMLRLKSTALLLIIILAIISAAYLIRSCRGNTLDVYVNDGIDITPTQITAMTETGEWEFLSVETEEIVDTVRKGWFGNDELTRIYFGTLRLGFDMRKADKDWIFKVKDTLYVTLPAISLLDEDFIDEARTQSFFESGKWSDKDRADLYNRAYKKMRDRCLTNENVRTAEQNAEMQFRKILKGIGFEHINIKFENKDTKRNLQTNRRPR